MAKIVVIDEQRCLSCKSCVLECAMAHTEARTLIEAINSESPPQPRLHVEPLEDFGMPLQCRHCEDAPCMMVCPTEAIQRFSELGPVLLDQEKCIGCKFCLLVCPFGVIDCSRDGKAMVKCDQCVERTEAGQEPACVAACPTGALKFVELDEYLRDRRRKATQMLAASRRPGQTAGKNDNGPE